jgi:pyruvate/2-oxoglutarate/acetoin dehydrogenase E1 component
MLRDPTITIHAEDLQAGSSFDIPQLTQQTYGPIRAADEIIDEGHFIGKALGEALNGYRPIVELMNATLASTALQRSARPAARSRGRWDGTQPSFGSRAQPSVSRVRDGYSRIEDWHRSPGATYGLTKSMIRDNGLCFLFAPVNMMKGSNGTVDLSKCLPLNKAALVHKASGKAVTVLTYLHGVKESLAAIDSIKEGGFDIDLIELRSLKPLDMDTIRQSLYRTNRPCILDESTKTGRVLAPEFRKSCLVCWTHL